MINLVQFYRNIITLASILTKLDNWHDIQGYAKLVEDRLPKEVCLNNTQILRAARTTEEEQVQGLQSWICRHNTLGGIRYPSWEIATRSCEACKRMQQND